MLFCIIGVTLLCTSCNITKRLKRYRSQLHCEKQNSTILSSAIDHTHSQANHNSTKNIIPQFEKCFIKIKKNSYIHQYALEKKTRRTVQPYHRVSVFLLKNKLCGPLLYTWCRRGKKQKEARK